MLSQPLSPCSKPSASTSLASTPPHGSIGAQVENELGFLSGDNRGYLRHLVATTRQHLGSQVVIYTTDPPPNVQKGSLPGREVFTWDPPHPPLPALCAAKLHPKLACVRSC